MSERTDQDLLKLTQRGDRPAAAELYARFAPRLRLLARSILNDEFLAADVVQGVFVKILDLKHHQAAQVSDPLAWLIRSTRNEALNLIRTDRRARARASIHASMRAAAGMNDGRAGYSAIGDSSGASSSRGPGGLAPSQRDEHDRLLDAMAALSPELRELIVLKHLVGMTFDQLAQTLGENRSTLSSRYRVALNKLKESLDAPSAASARHAPIGVRPVGHTNAAAAVSTSVMSESLPRREAEGRGRSGRSPGHAGGTP